jgi:hypothetical protein
MSFEFRQVQIRWSLGYRPYLVRSRGLMATLERRVGLARDLCVTIDRLRVPGTRVGLPGTVDGTVPGTWYLVITSYSLYHLIYHQ